MRPVAARRAGGTNLAALPLTPEVTEDRTRKRTMVELARSPHPDVTRVAGTLYLLLFPIPVVCLVGALVTDVMYWRSEFLMWLHFSQWLLATGLAFGALAALALLVEFLSSDLLRAQTSGWLHLALICAALVVGLFNAFVHTVDGWTAVVPMGMTLSLVGAVLALAAVAALFFVPVARAAPQRVRA